MHSSTGSGHMEVITSGTPMTLAMSSQPANRVDIQAKFSNTGVIYLGGAGVSAVTPAGIGLNPGDVYSIEKMSDLINILMDASVSGEGVTYTWWVGEVN